MDVHTESISIAVRNYAGKVMTECVIETKASVILQFIDGLRGDMRVLASQPWFLLPIGPDFHLLSQTSEWSCTED